MTDLYDELNAGREKFDAQQALYDQEDENLKKKHKATGLFEYVKDIHSRNGNHVDFRGYVPNVVNKHFSFSQRTVMMANEMNKAFGLPGEVQFQFLRVSIRKESGGFIQWIKPEVDDRIPLIMQVYKYSKEKAEEVVDLFTPEQLEALKQSLDKGGKS